MYQLIDPPFDSNFSSLSALGKEELKEYNRWFFQVKSDRLDILVNASGLTKEMMLTVDSLKYLGEWLVKEVNEMKKIKDFTGLLSRGFDIGIYFGEFVIKNHPGAYWIQSLKNRCDINFGEIVIRNFGTCDCNMNLKSYNIVTAMQNESWDNPFFSDDLTNVFIELYENLKGIEIDMKRKPATQG
jgi:hypothetical protein